MDTIRERLISAAEQASKNSYSPYSEFAVGAAVLTKGEEVFCGTNIENASYGGTMCAERVAVFKALSEGKREILALAVYAEKALPYPCGMCLQVLSEFAAGSIPVYLKSGAESKDLFLSDLLPYPFH